MAMTYDDSPEQAGEYARLALPFMTKHGIAPNPINYSVCYEYVAGTNVALRNALSEYLKEGNGVSNDQMTNLFHTHIAEFDAASLEDARDQIQGLLNSTLEQLSCLGGDLGKYASSLKSFTSDMGDQLDIQDVQEVFRTIIAETGQMQESGRQLEEQMQKSAEEAEALRENLDRIRHEAATDSLTGLANRKTFDSSIEAEIEAAREHSTSLVLLMMDIDHFKNINDTYGHLVGDKVIRFVASTLKKSIKGKDLAARYGGEEYAVILPDTELADAVNLADKIRNTIQSSQLKRSSTGEPLGQVTVSGGAAALKPGEDAKGLISRADGALYHSKKNGRNQISDEKVLIEEVG